MHRHSPWEGNIHSGLPVLWEKPNRNSSCVLRAFAKSTGTWYSLESHGPCSFTARPIGNGVVPGLSIQGPAAHAAEFTAFPSGCFQDDWQHRDPLCYNIMLCLCVRHYYRNSWEAEAMRVILQLLRTIGKDSIFFDLPPIQSRYKDLATASTGKEAGQYFLENGSYLGTSAKEQNLHIFQHPTIVADNFF